MFISGPCAWMSYFRRILADRTWCWVDVRQKVCYCGAELPVFSMVREVDELGTATYHYALNLTTTHNLITTDNHCGAMWDLILYSCAVATFIFLYWFHKPKPPEGSIPASPSRKSPGNTIGMSAMQSEMSQTYIVGLVVPALSSAFIVVQQKLLQQYHLLLILCLAKNCLSYMCVSVHILCCFYVFLVLISTYKLTCCTLTYLLICTHLINCAACYWWHVCVDSML